MERLSTYAPIPPAPFKLITALSKVILEPIPELVPIYTPVPATVLFPTFIVPEYFILLPFCAYIPTPFAPAVRLLAIPEDKF